MTPSETIWLKADMTLETVRAILLDEDCSVQLSGPEEANK